MMRLITVTDRSPGFTYARYSSFYTLHILAQGQPAKPSSQFRVTITIHSNSSPKVWKSYRAIIMAIRSCIIPFILRSKQLLVILTLC